MNGSSQFFHFLRLWKIIEVRRSGFSALKFEWLGLYLINRSHGILLQFLVLWFYR